MSEKICNGNIQTYENGNWVKIGNFELSEVSFENPNAPDMKGFGYIEIDGKVKKIYLNGWVPRQAPYYSNTSYKPTKKDLANAPIAVSQKSKPKKSPKLPNGKVPIP